MKFGCRSEELEQQQTHRGADQQADRYYQAIFVGLAAGLGWVATSFGINYLFERRAAGLLLINGGYHTLQFTPYGVVLGAMS